MRFLTSLSEVAAIAAILAGCAGVSAPSEAELSKADYGPYPQNYETVIKDHLRVTLRDPYSVMDLRVAPPTKCWFRRSQFELTHYGWCSVVSYNAKNAYGAYVGIRTTEYLIYQGEVMLVK